MRNQGPCLSSGWLAHPLPELHNLEDLERPSAVDLYPLCCIDEMFHPNSDTDIAPIGSVQATGRLVDHVGHQFLLFLRCPVLPRRQGKALRRLGPSGATAEWMSRSRPKMGQNLLGAGSSGLLDVDFASLYTIHNKTLDPISLWFGRYQRLAASNGDQSLGFW